MVTSGLPLWFDLTAAGPDAESLLGAVLQTGASGVLLLPSQIPDQALPERMHLAVLMTGAADLENLDHRQALTVVSVADLGSRDRPSTWRAGRQHRVDGAETLQQAVECLDEIDVLVLTFDDPTNIPLELVVAEAQSRQATVVKRATDLDDALVSSGVLQHGPDAVLLAVSSAQDIIEAAAAFRQRDRALATLVEAEVVSVRSIGMGMRGCIDTVDLFEENEGMVVGSTSAGGLIVCAEVHYLPYMNLRPFRVNAGAVHSYVWAPGDRTAYITDLAAGEPVLCMASDGRTRPMTVGRVKIETRPLRLISCVRDEVPINVIVQDDWHVRLFGAAGEVLNCTDITRGTKMLALAADPGRHVGVAVNETIVEV